MSKSNLLLITALSILICFSGCKKEISTSRSTKDYNLQVNNVDFEYLSTQSKIHYKGEDKNFRATVKFRIKKDSVIWAFVSPFFGVEAARAIITQDSLALINRLNQEYSHYTYKELSEKYNIDIDFGLIQACLLGNLPYKISSGDKISKKPEYYLVTQNHKNMKVTQQVGTKNFKLTKLVAESTIKSRSSNQKEENSLNLKYGDFQSVENQSFPFSNDITLKYKNAYREGKTEISIEHKQAEFPKKPLNFPFSVPKNYNKK